MKTVKALGMLAVVAIFAMALMGPTFAMAEDTSLCEVDEDPCNSPRSHVHYDGEVEVLTSTMDYHCDALFLGEVFELGAPQVVEGNFTYSKCNHECIRTEENGPAVLKFLKNGHESAYATGESLVHVQCTSFIDCTYTLVGIVGNVLGPLLASESNGEITFAEQTMQKEGGFLCPKSAKLDGNFEPLSATYISS